MIVNNNPYDRVSNRLQVVLITSTTNRVYPCEAIITLNGATRKTRADQITTVSKARFEQKMGSLSQADLRLIDAATRIQLAP